MTTYKTDKAQEMMEIKNRSYRLANNYKSTCVIVEGPGDGESTIMDLKEAIDNEFSYSW